MSARPVRNVRPPAKFTDGSSDVLPTLTSHRTAPTTTASPGSPSELLGTTTPTDLDVGSSPDVPTRTSTKRPHAQVAQPISSDTADVPQPEDALRSKKSKKTPATLPQKEASIIEIEDDTKYDLLNNSDATADIKEFFTAPVKEPDQEKARVECKKCK
jgi:hypothetical protein